MNHRQLLLLLLLLFSLAGISCSTVNSRPEPPTWKQQVEHGRGLVIDYGCTSCHEIPGILGVRGSIGPSLEHVASKYYLAGELPNSSENLRRWIQHPHSINANTVMPDMHVTDADAADIDLFLETLK